METREDLCLRIEEGGELKKIVIQTATGPKMYICTEAKMKDYTELLANRG